MLPLKIALWQRWTLAQLQRMKCWRGCFDANEALILLHGFNVNDGATSSANVECCRGFMTKINVDTASSWMKCWREFMASVQILLHDKDEHWHGFNANNCFMTKMNVGTASAKIKCCCGFVTKMNVGMTSVQILLHGKDECWHGFSTRTNAGTTSLQKTLDAALLQRFLTWLRCKDSWDDCVKKTSVGAT